MHEIDACRSTLTSACGILSSRASGERRPAGEDLVERCVQRQEGQDAAAQVGGAAGHPLRYMFDRGLRQRQPDREDAHPAAGGGEGESSALGGRTFLKGR